MRQRLPVAMLSQLLAWLVLLFAAASPAVALKPITLTGDQDRIEIAGQGEAHEGRGDQLQIETAPGADGTTGRMGVRALTPGTNPNWLAFALHNPTEKTIELWLTADRYNPVGSGVVWPDLDARRVEAVSHSSGFAPDRIRNDRTDIFRLTVERGQTITYVAELSSERFSRIYLWKPIEFEQRQRERQLFNGIMLGIIGLLAVFLTAVFAANHKMIFPSAALVAWCALAMLCVDFGFWHKLFQMRPEDNAQYRAASEASLAASLVIFLFAFLRVHLWSGFVRTLFSVWIIAQLAIVAMAVLDPRLSATAARLSLAGIGVVGGLVILWQSLRGIDRALAMAPTWLLFLVWLFGAGVTLTGRLAGEFAISGLVAGLVLITVMIGFTVTQFAFKSGEPVYGSSPAQSQMRLAAIEGASVAVWEWSARRDELKLDPEIELSLGLNIGDLPTKVDDFAAHLHPADKERFLLGVGALKERDGGSLHLELRIRHADSSYRWFEFDGATMASTDRRQLRCVGLIRDVTDAKRSQERLMHNAVHDSLTSLPNRELFLDRLAVSLQRAPTDPSSRPAVFFFDIDKFRSVNSAFGLIVGDSILLTVARRLSRNIQPPSTLARISGDQFALILLGHQDARELASIAERLRLALRSPIRMAGQEVILTGAIGIALYDGTQESARDLLREAEVAMYRAKRAGSDRVELFTAGMRGEKDQRIAIESDLRRAIEARQLKLLYQPIISLSSEELVGFEALVRWEHPRLGTLSPADFIPVAEESDLIVQLGSYVLGQAVTDLSRWHKELPRPDQPIFVSVNISSRQLIKPDLVNEIRHVLGRAVVPADALRLEITESLVMENPEQASHILDLLQEIGIQIAIDDFGTGYSSLAYLNRLPFNTIKIDKSIVQAGTDGGPGGVIVRSIVALAHELDKKLIAEGVESAEDATFLRSVGCQFAQGFHYGEPMPDAEVTRLLRLIKKADRRMRRRGLVRGIEKKKTTDGPSTVPVAMDGKSPVTAPLSRPVESASAPRTAAEPSIKDNGASAGVPPPFASGDPRTTPTRPSMAAPPASTVPSSARGAYPGAQPGPTIPSQQPARLEKHPNLGPPISTPVHSVPIVVDGVRETQPAAALAPSPQPPQMSLASTIDIALGRVRTSAATSVATPQRPEPNASVVPPASPADQMAVAAKSAQVRRPLRRTSNATLPPGIAERLARLAGKTGSTPAQADTTPDDPTTPPNAKKSAAE